MSPGVPAIDESFEVLYEEAPCGSLSLLPDGAIVRFNQTLLSWTGYSAEELYAKKRFAGLLTVPSSLLYETHCAPLLRMRGSISEIALDLLCSDGTRMPILLSAVAKRDPAGELCLFRVVLLNAPKRREYERELLAARTLAEDAAEQLRLQRVIAERKLAEQDALLQAMGHMAAGNLETPVHIAPDSELVTLARGLDRMRQDILKQIREMEERNREILHLNAELRHQIEQRSRLLFESMQSGMDNSPASKRDYSSAEALPILANGTLLAKRYRVEAILGQGAMGTVYEVERISDGRRFAAKVLSVKPDFRAMARFAREALVLARLQHPNLIAIVDLDITTDRVAYLVMELVRGKSLSELSARYGDRDFMLPVLRQIADGLTTVHSAGIVHRDLKPANVLITIGANENQATARLADFGISRLLQDDQAAPDSSSPSLLEANLSSLSPRAQGLDAIREGMARTAAAPAAQAVGTKSGWVATLEVRGGPADVALRNNASPVAPAVQPASAPDEANRQSNPLDALTQAGTLVGTLLYMAPELLGGTHRVQPSSDIFSFGMMAYEVLTGTLPFEEPPLLLAARGNDGLRFQPLDAACRGLSPKLARLLERCLSVNPASRPTAAELTKALGKTVIAPGAAYLESQDF